jgi:rSAM/selenodomain-associated transferase 1
MSAALLVIAKAPVAGRVKTRLCPPCSPAQAARLAEAALWDTLAAVAAVPAGRRIVVLDGAVGRWLPAGFEVTAQRGDGLADRLAAAFADGGGPALLVGMDTPQLRPGLLRASLHALAQPGTDAVLGHAPDGGYWAIGLRRPDPAVFHGVPMSAPDTGVRQAERLRELGLRTTELPRLRDVDRFADALAVAAQAPHGRFAAAVAAISDEIECRGRAAA